MSDKNLNIKSSTIEKGLELAQDFLGKLIFPTLEEVGLLAADNVKVWRFKNQVRLLNNVEKYVTEKNIPTKKVPLKILLPLLENASLEEEPLLNEMWENLLINYIDSSKTLSSVVFPRILSELASTEIILLQNANKNFSEKILINDEKFRGTSGSIPNVNNLIRLGILTQHSQFNYGAFAVLTSGALKPNDSIIDHNTIYLTKFGEEFIKACSK